MNSSTTFRARAVNRFSSYVMVRLRSLFFRMNSSLLFFCGRIKNHKGAVSEDFKGRDYASDSSYPQLSAGVSPARPIEA